MSCFYIQEEILAAHSARDAGGKARNDVDAVLRGMGLDPLVVPVLESRSGGGILSKLYVHSKQAAQWKTAVSSLHEGDLLVMQFPVVGHTVFFGKVIQACKRNSVKTVLFVHDLDALRYGGEVHGDRRAAQRIALEESSAIRQADAVIVHNDRMKERIADLYGVELGKIVTLGIFDYLTQTTGEYLKSDRRWDKDEGIAIAGNLLQAKAGYVYHLPTSPQFILYGTNFEGCTAPNIRYKGSYPADELPGVLAESFGLVWDGPNTDTCSGNYGEYMRINNPHKTSLYLAAGMPVIVWKDAAVADFVRSHKVGICISSLEEISAAIAALSEEEYASLVRNAHSIGLQLRRGYYTREALARVGKVLGCPVPQ